ncbi:uncharacterized protein LOC121992726 [Zingiber officinale]|uniref:uncharacterized protein LOC121992726 n=1 Tax=Zingiber officinale TaxID=94328 RepID=UPI001C4ACA32|nr:uncharacterized protein LOC121992726 [Zingiber officinale]
MSEGVTPTAATGDIVPPAAPPRRRSLSPRHLICLSVAAVLAAYGMVPSTDLAFAPFSLAYIYFLSAFAFPPLRSADNSPVFDLRNRLLGQYVSFAAFLGLLLPLMHILDCASGGDTGGAVAAAPHLFLLCIQVFLEGFTFSRGFSLPIFAFTPILYNSKRLVALFWWVASEFERAEGGRRMVAGRVLAVANSILWVYNLFGFLLPVYLPRVLKRYYAGSK